MPDIAIAVVGAGVHGSRYAEHLLAGNVPGARLAGVCRRTEADADRWRPRGVRFETSFAALVDDPAVDAVVVASPPVIHVVHALAVLARGKPLLLEKPVAPDAASCDRIGEAADRAGVPVLVGHSHRYNPVVIAFREAVAALGSLQGFAFSQGHERAPIPWQFERHGGGALLCLGVHLADIGRWITGEEISAESCRLEGAPGEAEGSASVHARTASGTPLAMDVSIAAPARRGFLEARGDRGRVEGDFVRHELARIDGGTRTPIPLPPARPGLVPLLGDFVRAARGDGPGLAATLDDGIAAVAFVEACLAAARHSPR